MLGVCERAAQADLLSVFILFINIYWAIIGQIAVIDIGLRDKKIKEKGGKHKNLISKKQKNGIRN